MHLSFSKHLLVTNTNKVVAIPTATQQNFKIQNSNGTNTPIPSINITENTPFAKYDESSIFTLKNVHSDSRALLIS